MQPLTQKITAEVMRANRIVFYPASEAESENIQRQLIQLGAYWGKNGRQPENLAETVTSGLLVEYGKLYYNPTDDSANRLATLENLDPAYRTPEQKRLQDEFNRLDARIDGLEKMLKEIHDAVVPKNDITKPQLKAPKA